MIWWVSILTPTFDNWFKQSRCCILHWFEDTLHLHCNFILALVSSDIMEEHSRRSHLSQIEVKTTPTQYTPTARWWLNGLFYWFLSFLIVFQIEACLNRILIVGTSFRLLGKKALIVQAHWYFVSMFMPYEITMDGFNGQGLYSILKKRWHVWW